MITSTNRHQPKWLPWLLWFLWNPVDAIGCRNEHTGVTDHAKICTVGLIIAALALHAVGHGLPWWALLILGTLCFGDRGLYTILLKSGIFKGTFAESVDAKTETSEKSEKSEEIKETVEIRQARDPKLGIDPA